MQVHEALEGQQHLVGDAAAELFWRLRQRPLQTADVLAATGQRMVGYQGSFRQQLQLDQQALAEQLEELQVGALEQQQACRGQHACGLCAAPSRAIICLRDDKPPANLFLL